MSYLPIKTGQIVYGGGRLLRVLHQGYDPNKIASDSIICVKESLFGHLVALLFRWLEWIRVPISRYEARHHGIKEGEFFTKPLISYYIGRIYEFSNNHGFRIDAADLKR